MINENENVEISLAESIKIFRGSDEGFNHVGLHKVTVELIQLRQPEVTADDPVIGSAAVKFPLAHTPATLPSLIGPRVRRLCSQILEI